ncbi:MAG: flagellar hook-associated protein FlgK, partial [Planctomycetota bacterium]
MSGLGLGIGLKGLLSSRSAMDVIGNNLSNASTPGYSRQELSVSSGRQINLRGLGFGTGVDGQVVNRSIDELLQKRIVEQIGNMNSLDARLDVLRQVESILGEPGEFGLQTKLESFFSGFGELATDPSDPVLRSGAVQSADALASRLRTLSAEVQDLDGNQLGQVSAQVGRVNELTNFVSRLNQDIAQTEASGIPANQMRDQRELALKELGALVDVRYVEDDIGIVRVTVGGQLVVGAEQAYPIEANKNEDGEIELTLRGNDKPLQVRSGALGGLTQANGGGGTIGDLGARLDRLASNLVLEANRQHSTGVPLDGPFQSLIGTNALTDEDGDGTLTDELLTDAGLPFDVQDGRLHINVTEEATGLVQTHKIDIDADRMTVAEFVQELDAIDRISAEVDPEGKLRINSDGGYGFDFAARLETAPDPNGTFGGGRPSIG